MRNVYHIEGIQFIVQYIEGMLDGYSSVLVTFWEASLYIHPLGLHLLRQIICRRSCTYL